MRHALPALVLILLIPGIIWAGGFRFSLPVDVEEAHLLSGGTQAVMEHIRSRYEGEIADLRSRYRIEALEDQAAKAEEALRKKNQAYTDRLSSLRKEYLSSLTITLDSIEAFISPSSSALGDVTFFYTAHNKSDRIITDIIYRPLIKAKNLPATTTLVLEFIHPQTLISGIGPREIMTNRGHAQERFSFFISELTQGEIKALQADAAHQFGIEVIDMHFAERKGYKGQIAVQDFETAFSRQLDPLRAAVEYAEADLKTKKDSYSRAHSEFTAAKDRIAERFKQSLGELKKSSVRYSAHMDKKNQCVFDDVVDGAYYLYASDGKGSAVFEKVAVTGGKPQEVHIGMKKDPFAP